ncbi:MAG: hypothetical protein M3O31_06905 [Acidobacteriota bacterium]|nr:hypothetical protein [Acidobacteriota bacterium]
MNPSTILLRQIHPKFVQNGRPTSQAFRPTPKDEDKLSVYDGDQIQPQPSWEHYTAVLGLESKGVMGITLGECSALELSVTPDAATFAEHALIDFSGLTKSVIEKKAKLLAQSAVQRDWLYRPIQQI